ncbi:hypothetical protein AB0K23_18375 [Streptomyces sp. NPDC049602]|uniref:hypothetical protein n=1 Tax=Streptomyces sp. NPDC049602 TaxID=3155504 RepID=UPI00341F22A3
MDEFLEGLVLGHLGEHFAGGTDGPVAWRGEKRPAELRRARQEIEVSIAAGEVPWGEVRGLLLRLGRSVEGLESERREHAEQQATGLRGWSRERWGRMAVREKREVIARVLASVLVLTVPEGVSDKAPFDPELLRPSWRWETPSRGHAL